MCRRIQCIHEPGGRAVLAKREHMVPKKGLEPPHPCEYMDLNHARLPIPPLRHLMMRQTNPGAATGNTHLILKGLLIVSNSALLLGKRLEAGCNGICPPS